SQLLTFARKGVINKTNLTLNNFVKEASKLAQIGLPENIEVHCNITTERLITYADATQLQQLMMNLINNAHDAVAEVKRPQISVMLSLADKKNSALRQFNPPKKRYAELSIMDNGSGISEENLTKITEPFFTTKEQGKGTGLGLAMVHGIVESHQGFMNISSEEGHGATFHIFLPLVEGENNESSTAPEVVYQGHGESILLVDDDLMVRETGREILESLGYNVFLAENGLQAIEAYQKYSNHLALVLMDVVMPRLQGSKAAILIKKSYPELPIILITGYDRKNVMNEDVLTAIDGTLSKPYTVEQLNTKLHETLG
ncbi:MAG: ATP-binding protein, partial [Mariprofundaceae bacterium]|nr:ATP-binding protein [Mariprofundaceae bacterium]